ncbi:MAG: leucine-rich repeat protein [Clostridiales bacterium]|jgi:serine/threonine protein kinase|nr:leucine-rich repeat protein [Clostridiales bacterium]
MNIICGNCFKEFDYSQELCPYCGHEKEKTPEGDLFLPVGTLLKNRYIIGRVLRQDTLGIVYLVWNIVLEQKEVIKEYFPVAYSTRMDGYNNVIVIEKDKASDFRLGMEKFAKDAGKLAQFCNLDNVIRIYTHFFENNTVYVVMEFQEGLTLSKYLETSGQLSADEAIVMMDPIIKTLQFLHENSVYHLNITTDNIIVTKDRNFKLIGFGVSKSEYSLVEQYSPQADVYGVGSVLYKMITGITPPASIESPARSLTVYTDKINIIQDTAILNAIRVPFQDYSEDMKTFERELFSKDKIKKRKSSLTISKTNDIKMPLRVKIIIYSITALIAASFLIFFIYNINKPDDNILTAPLIMPDLTSLYEKDALSILSSKGISAEVTYVFNSSYLQGIVISQDIPAGSEIENNVTVKLTVSHGPEMISVPNVIGLTEEEARYDLTILGFQVTVTYKSCDLSEVGLVLDQELIPNLKVTLGSIMVIDVGKFYESHTYDGFEYRSMDNGSITITGYQGDNKNIVIPAIIEGTPVSSIESYAFYGTSISSVYIPANIKTIGADAFLGCSSLQGINVDANNTNYSSQDGVLYNKDVTEVIKIPETKYGMYTLPTGISSVKCSYFTGCKNITSIEIPKTVITIESAAFSECTALEQIHVDVNNKFYSGRDGVLYNKKHTVLLQYPKNKEGDYTIPEETKSIGDSAFRDCQGLNSILIYGNLSNIGEYAFYNCTNLRSVMFNGSVANISASAFGNCLELTSLSIPEGLISLDIDALQGTGLTSLNIPASMAVIENDTISGCNKLTSITVDEKNSVFSSLDGVLFNKDKTVLLLYPSGKPDVSYTIPDSVTEIKPSAFYECKLAYINIPDCVANIENVFTDCSYLTTINVANNNPAYFSQNGVLFSKDRTCLILYPIGKQDSLYNIPEGVVTLSSGAFWNNTFLTSVTIPESVAYFSENVFNGCYNLLSARFQGDAPSSMRALFYNCAQDFTIYYHQGTAGWYNLFENYYPLALW